MGLTTSNKSGGAAVVNRPEGGSGKIPTSPHKLDQGHGKKCPRLLNGNGIALSTECLFKPGEDECFYCGGRR